jgi:AcrR family transcriptional regulator
MEIVTSPTNSESNKRGRPRSGDVEQAILNAAAQLLAERGLQGLTIEDVASLAKVGKTSIYRRWPSKGTLALEAFLGEFLLLQPPVDTGSLTGDLQAALSAWVRAVAGTPTGRSLVALIAEAQFDPDLSKAWSENVVATARNQHRSMIERAIAREEIPIDSDVDVLMDMLYGPAYHRLLQGHLPLSEGFVQQVVAVVVAGAKAGSAVPPNTEMNAAR